MSREYYQTSQVSNRERRNYRNLDKADIIGYTMGSDNDRGYTNIIQSDNQRMENTNIMGQRNRIKNYLTAPIASQYFQLDEWVEFEKALNEFIWGTNFNQTSFFKKYNLGDSFDLQDPGPDDDWEVLG
jgi:hypothetical protein